VAKGQQGSIKGSEESCVEIHGGTGLDTHNAESMDLLASMDGSEMLVDEKAVIHMSKAIPIAAASSPNNQIAFVCVGPSTNLALLITLFPEVKQHISKVVLMAGSIGIGNMSPAAEWNVLVDSIATDIVFRSGIPIVQVPVEVTHQVLVTDAILERIRSLNSPFSRVVIDLLCFFQSSYKETFEFDHPPLHDPVAVFFLIAPDLFKTRLMNVSIETTSALCDGRTVCDYFGITKRPKNTTVCLSVDVDQFWDHMIAAITLANDQSPLNN